MNGYLPFYFVVVFFAIAIAFVLSRKREEDGLIEALPLSVFNKIDEAIVAVGPDLSIRFANAEAEKLLKNSLQDMTGKKISEFFDNLPTQDSSGRSANCIAADKAKIPVSVRIKRMEKSGKTTGYIYFFADISEIKERLKVLEQKSQTLEEEGIKLNKLEQEIEIESASTEERAAQRTRVFEEEHARLLSSINNLNIGFIMTDQYKNIQVFNESASGFFRNLKNKPITIKNLQEAEHLSYDLDERVEAAIVGKKTVDLGDTLINERFAKIIVSPIILEKNQGIIGAIILIEDVDAKHKLEESKEDLFSIASHELRTPLTAIYGYTSLIKQLYPDDLKDPELRNIINNIGVLSKKLSLSINNFLDSAKLEQDKIELKKEPCDLYTIINEAIKETERTSLEKNLYIKFDPPDSQITLIGDQARLIQVMIILLTNAIKFTQVGGITIGIHTGLENVKISIQDTGTGIAEENKKLIFSKFQQTEENLLTKQEGTGLGLHIAKLLIEKMRGAIWIERSELNKGTTFSFTIPIVKN